MTFSPVDVFEQIINREIPAEILLETDRVVAFRDINPKARTHILIVPRSNIKTALDITPDNVMIFGELILIAKYVAEMEGLEGYKLHMNVGEKGGQVIPHVHLHLLSADFQTGL
jgi:histidine triad (HIT) family protein